MDLQILDQILVVLLQEYSADYGTELHLYVRHPVSRHENNIDHIFRLNFFQILYFF